MKKYVGKVTFAERDEIQQLFERRNGLDELAMIVDREDDELYESLVSDTRDTDARFHEWWRRMSAAYKWESVSEGHWEIDFETCGIFLVVSDGSL